jgi:hypothetical protein
VVFNNKVLVINSISHDLSTFKNFPAEKLNKTTQAVINIQNEEIRVPNLEPLNTNKEEVINSSKEVSRIMNLEQLKNEHPNLLLEIQNAAKEEGRKEERARIKEIEEISNVISPEIVKKAKFEEPVNAEKLAFLALQNNAQKGNQYLNNVAEDAESSGAEDVIPAPQAQNNENQKPKTITDKIKNAAVMFDKNRRGVKAE